MQTRKRAKSVKFGKKTSEESKKRDVKSAVINHTKNDENLEIKTEQNENKKEAFTQEETDNAQEIKKQIAASISSKAEAENEEIPEEVKLTNDTEDSKNDTSQPQSQSAFGSFTQDIKQPPKRNNLLFFIIIVLVTFIIGLIAIGGFYYFTNKSSISLTSTPTPTPTAVPSSTEDPVNLSEFSIGVLNGSGISGEAAKVKTQLTDAGFTVDSVGNADNSNYTKTIIATKEKVSKSFIDKLSEELGKTYMVEEKIETLDGTENTDIIITIGSSTTK